LSAGVALVKLQIDSGRPRLRTIVILSEAQRSRRIPRTKWT